MPRDYSFNIYKMPGHTDCSEDGHMTQTRPTSFPKIHVGIIREKPFLPEAAKLQEFIWSSWRPFSPAM